MMDPHSGDTAGVSLGDMPVEVAYQIAKDLDLSSKYHLMCTCKSMYTLVYPLVYGDDENIPRALRWGCAHGLIRLITKMLDKGIALDYVFDMDTMMKTSRPEDELLGRHLSRTPLATAVAFRQLEVVWFLLGRGARVSFAPSSPPLRVSPYDWQPRPFSGYTPIQWALAVRLNHIPPTQRGEQDQLTEEIVRTLILHRAHVGQRSLSASTTPLEMAFQNRDVPTGVVEIILLAGITSIPNTPSDLATIFRLFAALALSSSAMEPYGGTFLSDSRKEKFEIILSRATTYDFHTFMLDDKFHSLLYYKPTPAMLEALRIFLRHMNNRFPEYRREWHIRSPLLTVVVAFHAAADRFKFNPKFQPDFNNLIRRQLELLGILFEAGAPLESVEPPPDCEETGVPNTFLTALCFYDQPPVAILFGDALEWALAMGASPMGRDIYGHTPLHYALENALMPVVSTLLEVAPWDDLLDNEAESIDEMLLTVCGAEQGGHCNADRVSLAVFLIRSGASVNYLSSERGSPLAEAARIGDKDLVRALYQHGADPNMAPAPLTPLYMALYEPKLWDGCESDKGDELLMTLVETLLEGGADAVALQEEDEWDLHLGTDCPMIVINLILESMTNLGDGSLTREILGSKFEDFVRNYGSWDDHAS
ncbi:putative ankyrin-1 isoform X4 [Rosellinia necatrix]|uniref:Putative ankyrin-1 isoform X4 n=1 Tax=Rosellinia necatrix TaxID=77044 RepID=A0A1S7UIW5_ROSNE|nr:putative ankyrin-1 isoform X4 [Rosellinia necatrix]